MAQRVIDCGGCGAQIEVPDDYFKKHIRCYQCHAVLNRHTGEVSDPTANATQQPAPPPAQQPYPAESQYQQPYPQQAPYPYPQPQPKRGMPAWAIVLVVIFGGVLLMGVLVGVLAVAVIPRIADANLALEGRIGDYGSWVSHTPLESNYTARFPKTPQRESNPASDSNFATVSTYSQYVNYRYEVVEVDFRTRNWRLQPLSHQETVSHLARQFNGTISEQGAEINSSSKSIIDMGSEGQATVVIRDVSDRRFVLIEFRNRGQQSHFDYFHDNFQPSN
jgi:hypothetical protein